MATEEPLVRTVARRLALAGFGTINGDPRVPPEGWDAQEWEARVLDCIPGRCEAMCLEAAEAVIEIVKARSPCVDAVTERIVGCWRTDASHVYSLAEEASALAKSVEYRIETMGATGDAQGMLHTTRDIMRRLDRIRSIMRGRLGGVPTKAPK